MESNKKRLFYIDNLRIILVILVVLSHAAITYGPIGFWYYYERTELASTYFLAFYVSLIQAFLMGLFFMISAFFISFSLAEKGPKKFINSRLKRLGIPLVFYIIFISPAIRYLDYLIIKGKSANYFIFYYEEILKKGVVDAGPLWFLQVLLFFSILYAIVDIIATSIKNNRKELILKFPSNKNIFISIIILGLTTFFLRLKFPVSSNIVHLNFGLAPQYIFLFALGIIASNNKWFEAITAAKAKLWFGVSMVAIIIWPLFIISNWTSPPDIEIFLGGLRWQAFAYSFWEAVLSISMPISIIYFFRKRLNFQNKLFKIASKSAYTVFIIHSVIIVLLSYSLRNMLFHPLVKFLIVGLSGVIICFIIAFFITKIRFLRNII